MVVFAFEKILISIRKEQEVTVISGNLHYLNSFLSMGKWEEFFFNNRLYINNRSYSNGNVKEKKHMYAHKFNLVIHVSVL